MKGWDVIVVGTGIVGAATARYVAEQGLKCLVLDRTGPAAEASGANAGFIGYAHALETGTVEFVKKSLALVFQLAEEEDLDLVRDGYLLVALTPEQLAHLRELHSRAFAAGLRSELVGPDELKALEPELGDGLAGGLLLSDAGHLDPVKTTLAFVRRAQLAGAEFRFGIEVTEILTERGRVTGVRTQDGFAEAGHVVLAAGAWSKQLAATCRLKIPVEPARGQMLATKPLPHFTRRVIRGPEVGLRQNQSGEVIVGSTVEFVGFNKDVDPATIETLLQKAARMVPRLAAASVGRTWAGLRPMTPDLLPVVGRAPGIEGLWLATGHSRTGMSYGPGTGLAIAQLIAGGRSSLPIAAFRPERFARTITDPEE